jgi:hypothetical protein
MKTLSLTFFALLSANNMFAQDNLNYDDSLKKTLVGEWHHVSSTYPGGYVMTYERDLYFSHDGTGICTKYFDTDTVQVAFNWEIRDSVVYLYVNNKRGVRIDGDAQLISGLASEKIYFKDAWGEDQAGKVCCYKRDTEIAGAKF